MAAFYSDTVCSSDGGYTIFYTSDVWPIGESWQDRARRVKWEKAVRMHQAHMASMVLARDDRPVAQMKPRSRPCPLPDLSHRQRCPRLRAPIPQYDRRSM